MFKYFEIALPALLAFGPVFFMMGVPASSPMLTYNLLAGVLMMSIGSCMLFTKISKLEKRLEKLENDKTKGTQG